MQQESLLRRSLVLTGILLGLSVAWIGLVSVISVLLADRVVLSLEAGRSPAVGDAPAAGKPAQNAPTLERAGVRAEQRPTSPKPNG